MLNLLNIDFGSNENKFSSLAYPCRNDIAVLNKFNANGVSILVPSFKKHAFADRVFTLMLVYRKQSMNMQGLFADVANLTSNTLHRNYSKELEL